MNQPDLVKCGDHNLANYLYCLQCYTDLCAECYRTHPKNHVIQELDVALLKIRYRYEPLLEAEDLRAEDDDEKIDWESVYKLMGLPQAIKKDEHQPQEHLPRHEQPIPVNENFVPRILDFYQECELHPYTFKRWYLACGSCYRKVCYQCFYVNGYSLESAHSTLAYYHMMVQQWQVDTTDEGYFSA